MVRSAEMEKSGLKEHTAGQWYVSFNKLWMNAFLLWLSERKWDDLERVVIYSFFNTLVRNNCHLEQLQ